jgi:hypothetical protein
MKFTEQFVRNLVDSDRVVRLVFFLSETIRKLEASLARNGSNPINRDVWGLTRIAKRTMREPIFVGSNAR